MSDKLVYKDFNDVCRIYETQDGFELRYNSFFYGDPVYFYTTLKGAKIAMTRMNNGIYRDLKFPSTDW